VESSEALVEYQRKQRAEKWKRKGRRTTSRIPKSEKCQLPKTRHPHKKEMRKDHQKRQLEPTN
jgi:hypothetical protein